MKYSPFISSLLMLLGLLACQPALAHHTDKTYTFAVVPQYDVRTIYSTWQPILRHLEEAIGHHIVLDTSPDIPTFEKRLNNGVYDFAYANPMQFLRAALSQGYQALLRDDSRSLQGIVVARKNGDISQVEQLKGRGVAFPAPNALGASLMVRYELERLRHIDLHPSYVKTHNSAYLQVATGRMDAAGGVMSTLLQQPMEVRERLQIIYRTEKVKPHPIAVHPRVDKKMRKQFIQAFLSLADTRKGKKLLATIPLTKPVIAGHKDYQYLKQHDMSALIHE